LHPLLDPIIGRNWWTWLRERDWLWPNFPAVDGAIGAVDQLRRQGHYIEILTAKPEWATFAVWKWLGKWRPRVNAVTIVDTKGESKHGASDADLLIDDKIDNCVSWAASTPNRQAILFGLPFNECGWTHPDVIRSVGWPATVDLITELIDD
jgi:hypothetical protein